MDISTEERLGALLRLSREAYAAAERPECWPEFLDAVATRCESSAAAIVAVDDRHQQHLYSVAGGVSEAEWQEYVTDILPVDPRVELLRGQPDLNCIHDGDMAGLPTRQPSRFRYWLSRHAEWRSVVGARLHWDAERSVCALLLRDAPRDPAQDRALADFRHLVPALRHATLMSETLLSRRAAERAVNCTLDYLPTAVLLLDVRANVLYRNAAARRLVSQSAALRVRDGRLRLARTGDQHTLYGEVRAVLRHGSAQDRRRMFRFSTGPSTLTALVAPVPAPARAFCRGTAAALVMIWSAALSGLCRDALRETFGLSHREAELAANVAEGCTLNEAADRMGIKRSTVRVHLEHVLNKTGTHRQTELVSLLRCSSACSATSPADARSL